MHNIFCNVHFVFITARSPTTVSPVLPGTAAVVPGPPRAPIVTSHGSASELVPHAANVMTAWTDKLYTENMGIIFTNAVTPSAAVPTSTAATASVAASTGSSAPGVVSGGTLMNNGRQDTSLADIQKLQQQLQDIKDQVGTSAYYCHVTSCGYTCA